MRGLEKLDCNRFNKLVLETVLFNLIFSSSNSGGSRVINNMNGKSGKTILNINNNRPNSKKGISEYTLVLDLDETMVHYFFVSYH